jgi:D-3-phosphoglycerate dehydrogenase
MSKGKILITPRSLSKNGHPELQRLIDAGYELSMPFPGKQPNEEELLSELPGCVGFLAGVEKIGPAVLSRCTELKVISRNGVGIDNVDRPAAKKNGITLCIARGANSRGVAELAMSLILSLTRSVPQTNESVKNGGWDRFKGREVFGRTLGVIGTGQIGQLVAKMAVGMDVSVIGHDPYPVTGLEDSIPGFRYVPLEQLIAGSEFISLHCPADEKPLINPESLGRMKTGSYLINTARSALVDQAATLEAIESGKLAGYAVDAYESEPPEMTALYRHPKVIMTSHIGGFTEESVQRATAAAVDNLLEVLEG